jgi:hypothetical protein
VRPKVVDAAIKLSADCSGVCVLVAREVFQGIDFIETFKRETVDIAIMAVALACALVGVAPGLFALAFGVTESQRVGALAAGVCGFAPTTCVSG